MIDTLNDLTPPYREGDGEAFKREHVKVDAVNLTLHEFINRVRSLYNIDHYKLPELTDEQWPEFRDDPPRYFIKTDKVQAEAIFREVEKRQTRTDK